MTNICEFDRLKFVILDVDYAIGASGLILAGGTFGCDGVASASENIRIHNGGLNFALGTSVSDFRPLTGGVSRQFSSESLEGNFHLQSMVCDISGDITDARSLLNGPKRFLGINIKDVLGVELGSMNGSASVNFESCPTTPNAAPEFTMIQVFLNVGFLDRFLTKGSDFRIFNSAGIIKTSFGLCGEIDLLGFDHDGNVQLEYSDDAVRSNDEILFWTTFRVFGVSRSTGLEI